MKKRNWFERLTDALGGGQQGAKRAAGSSKHERGKRKPHGWHTAKRKAKRKEHKRQKLARRAQRGKR